MKGTGTRCEKQGTGTRAGVFLCCKPGSDATARVPCSRPGTRFGREPGNGNTICLFPVFPAALVDSRMRHRSVKNAIILDREEIAEDESLVLELVVVGAICTSNGVLCGAWGAECRDVSGARARPWFEAAATLGERTDLHVAAYLGLIQVHPAPSPHSPFYPFPNDDAFPSSQCAASLGDSVTPTCARSVSRHAASRWSSKFPARPLSSR